MESGPGPAPIESPQHSENSITKVKKLMCVLTDCVSMTFISAAHILQQNHSADCNLQDQTIDARLELSNIEELVSLSDQMEMHLCTAVECIQQAQLAAHYFPLTITPSQLDPIKAHEKRQETTLSYPSFLSTVRLQISYAKDIHDTLVAAAQNIAPAE